MNPSLENHEARIADLESAVHQMLNTSIERQKGDLKLLKAIQVKSDNFGQVSRLLIRIMPELPDKYIMGLLHTTDAESEFVHEAIDEAIARLESALPPEILPPEAPPTSPGKS